MDPNEVRPRRLLANTSATRIALANLIGESPVVFILIPKIAQDEAGWHFTGVLDTRMAVPNTDKEGDGMRLGAVLADFLETCARDLRAHGASVRKEE